MRAKPGRDRPPPALADGRVGWGRGPGRREANRGRSRGADGAVAEPEQALSETWLQAAAGLRAGDGLKGESGKSTAGAHGGKGASVGLGRSGPGLTCDGGGSLRVIISGGLAREEVQSRANVR